MLEAFSPPPAAVLELTAGLFLSPFFFLEAKISYYSIFSLLLVRLSLSSVLENGGL